MLKIGLTLKRIILEKSYVKNKNDTKKKKKKKTKKKKKKKKKSLQTSITIRKIKYR